MSARIGCSPNRHSRRQVCRERLTKQQDQCVLGLRAGSHLCRVIGVGLLDDRFRLAQGKLGAGARIELQLHDLVRSLRRLERLVA